MPLPKIGYGLTMCATALYGALSLGLAPAQAQDMRSFLSNLNRQMSIANQNYRAGVAIYNSVPFYKKLDYKCAHGDMRACQLHQQQLNNANDYMARRYSSLGR